MDLLVAWVAVRTLETGCNLEALLIAWVAVRTLWSGCKLEALAVGHSPLFADCLAAESTCVGIAVLSIEYSGVQLTKFLQFKQI